MSVIANATPTPSDAEDAEGKDAQAEHLPAQHPAPAAASCLLSCRRRPAAVTGRRGVGRPVSGRRLRGSRVAPAGVGRPGGVVRCSQGISAWSGSGRGQVRVWSRHHQAAYDDLPSSVGDGQSAGSIRPAFLPRRLARIISFYLSPRCIGSIHRAETLRGRRGVGQACGGVGVGRPRPASRCPDARLRAPQAAERPARLGPSILLRHPVPLPEGTRSPRVSGGRGSCRRTGVPAEADAARSSTSSPRRARSASPTCSRRPGRRPGTTSTSACTSPSSAATDAATRLRILEGRRSRLEERLEQFRSAVQRTRERLDTYTLELQNHGLESVEREVRWLDELIETERRGDERRGRPAVARERRPIRGGQQAKTRGTAPRPRAGSPVRPAE